MSNNFQTWLSMGESCNLLGIKKDTLRKSCTKGKYETKSERINGKKEYWILLESLPEDIQSKYYEKEKNFSVNIEMNVQIYNKAPRWAKEKANKYISIINKSKGLFGKDLIDFVYNWNLENAEYKTSYCRIIEARKKYKELGIAGLLGKYGNNAGKTKIKDTWYQYFKSLYLKEGAPSANSCRMYTYGFALQSENIELNRFPLAASFLKKLRKEIPESAIYLARYGDAAWNRKYANYIDRDYSDVNCGYIWVSDHAQIDIAVFANDGNVVFPWVTVWRDFKSGKWLGWLLHEESGNSDHIFQSFYYSALDYGIPYHVYIDNGKDYRAKDFAGGRQRLNESQASYMLGLLEIEPHFALPYNAQTKPVERDFLKIKEYLSKHAIGYRGGNVVERPEILKQEIKQNKIYTFEEFKLIFDDFIENVLNKLPSNGKALNGKSPNQLWNEEFSEKRVVSQDALSLFCTRTSRIVSIGRNGIRDSELEVTYWEEWMSAYKGEKVYTRRDINSYQEAWVFKAQTDEYLGKANISELVPALAQDNIQKSKLKEAVARKKKDKKITKSYIKIEHSDINENLQNIKNAANKLGNVKNKDLQILQLANTFMDKVIADDKQKQNADNVEVSKFYKPQKIQKKKIYHLKCEKEMAAEDNLGEEDIWKRLMSS